MIVTIDGPAGSGKSTVASALAARLGAAHVDTGAFYRAATLAVLRSGADVHDESACARVVAESTIRRDGRRTLLDGEDVEAQIRGADVTRCVSAVSAHESVRALLVPVQRAHIPAEGAVVEGRDAGTVVVPDADLKVWLTASHEARAARRARQLGEDGAVAAHALDLARRDAADAARMVAATDAVTLDTTGRSVQALVDELVELLDRRRQHQ